MPDSSSTTPNDPDHEMSEDAATGRVDAGDGANTKGSTRPDSGQIKRVIVNDDHGDGAFQQVTVRITSDEPVRLSTADASDTNDTNDTADADESDDATEALAAEYRGAADDEPGRRPFRFTFKLLVFAAITYYFVVPLIPDFQQAWSELRTVNPVLIALGFALENIALWCYAPLMQTALGDAGKNITRWRLYRIQMSTRALQSIIPGGSAASSALGYRLMTLSGVRGPDAGFALATVGLGSALVLNVILWIGLVVSIPVRGVNPIYGTAALVGIILMLIAGALVYGLMEGQGRSERAIRWIARKLHIDEDKAALVLHRVAERLEQLLSDRQLLGRVVFWAALNWLLDASALWVFLRAFGVTMDPDALLIAFGIANVLAAIPITPGGLGYVDIGMIGMLVGFGARRSQVVLAVPAYRFAQLFLPIIIGGLCYLSLRVGPWSIERRDRLQNLRQLADAATRDGESRLEFQLRQPTRGRRDRVRVWSQRDDTSDASRRRIRIRDHFPSRRRPSDDDAEPR